MTQPLKKQDVLNNIENVKMFTNFSKLHEKYFYFFILQSYADEGHELQGVLRHVYNSMEDYFIECLKLDTDDKKMHPDT